MLPSSSLVVLGFQSAAQWQRQRRCRNKAESGHVPRDPDRRLTRVRGSLSYPKTQRAVLN